jgi:hypothetical protein
MFNVVVTLPTDVFAAIDDQLQQTPVLMERAFNRASSRLRSRLLEQLREQPGAPKYPLRWTSQRQRRYVMAKLRAEGNLPYQRTGELAKAWHVEFASLDNGGAITIWNDAAVERYVEGYDQQMMHADTGWPFAPQLIADFQELATDVIIETWYTVSDFNAGAQG